MIRSTERKITWRGRKHQKTPRRPGQTSSRVLRMTKPLHGKVAVVAGATRGAGRGIACMLGEAGATVYCTGRSTRQTASPQPKPNAPFELSHRPETIEETAEMVQSYGGIGIPVRVDHSVEAEVKRLFEQVKAE